MKERLNFRNFLGMAAPPVLYVVIMQLSGYLAVAVSVGLQFAGIFRGNTVTIGWEQLNFMATAIAAVIGVPVFYWLLERDRTRCPSDYRYERVKKGKYVYIILIGLLGAGALNKFLSLLQIDRIFTGYEETAGVLYSTNIWLELAVLGLIVPITEELIFRGVVYERMKRCFSLKMAAFLCSLFFGVYHGNVSQGIYAFLLGLLLVYVKERYHSMAAPVLFHMSANIYSVLASETPLLEWTAGTLEMFLATMILEAAVSVVLLWRIEEEISPKKVKKNREWHNDSENYRKTY